MSDEQRTNGLEFLLAKDLEGRLDTFVIMISCNHGYLKNSKVKAKTKSRSAKVKVKDSEHMKDEKEPLLAGYLITDLYKLVE